MTQENSTNTWHFIDASGTFALDNPQRTNYLYFPLVNEAGMMSAITPSLHGDIKTGHNVFLTPPVSVEDLQDSRSARNFWITIQGAGAWSVAGQSAAQIARTFSADEEQVRLEAGFLWHQITRDNARIGVRADVTSFVPVNADQVELMKVRLTNTGQEPITFVPTAAIPLYGRSADNLRDHRHVTSLLHRIRIHPYGVLVQPTLSFDERGHRPNAVVYGVLGVEANGTPPEAFYPVLEEFIGEGGSLEWPQAVVEPGHAGYAAGRTFDGYEAFGGLRFADVTLQPGQSQEYVLILAVMPGPDSVDALVRSYGNAALFEAELTRCKAHWQEKLKTLTVQTADRTFDLWIKWVTVQPVLRRLFGNSFLPYHDYGRGGRGWRDLWQDCLALLLTEPESVRSLLLSSYAGVRIDGSNATIIGARPGEFIADRNNIPRVWMDHGAWPFLTTRLYLDQSGDLAFLLREQAYFKDPQINRCQKRDDAWTPEQGTRLRTATGSEYHGSILEHILVQHLTSFFNVGEHNIIRLEGADWNDAMDMARQRGESVAFTALYASNLLELSQLVRELTRQGTARVELAAELLPLLDTLNDPVNYEDPAAKQQRLAAYFATCEHAVSGNKAGVTVDDLARDLTAKADWLYGHLRRQEWLQDESELGWFNGYYDDDGHRVEGPHPAGTRITLTGQVFMLMGGIATDDQMRQIVCAADHYLWEPAMSGYRLNTDFGGVLLNLGRGFGFAFGHKENGAMFSHMAVMFANALYRRGMIGAGHKVLEGIYRHCRDFPVSRMYPGIPEYINPHGRGMYTYLTGSASWLLLTLVTEVFGVKGWLGALALEPKLLAEQFSAAGEACIETMFAGRQIKVIYHNPAHLDYGAYAVQAVSVDAQPVPFERANHAIVIARSAVASLDPQAIHRIDVTLG